MPDKNGKPMVGKHQTFQLIHPETGELIGNRVRIPWWNLPLLKHPTELDWITYSLWGGRGSGKTWLASLATLQCMFLTDWPVLLTREVKDSIDDSSKGAIEGWIKRLDVGEFFRVENEKIYGLIYGSEAILQGISTATENQIKSMEGIKWTWGEQMEAMSESSWDKLTPTLGRQEHCVNIWSWNPENKADSIYKESITNPEEHMLSLKVNYTDNPYFTQAMEIKRKKMEKDDPDKHHHIYGGFPRSDSDRQVVITEALAETCVEAYREAKKRGLLDVAREGFHDSGYDCADTGKDHNAYADRQGAVLEFVDRWRGSVEITIHTSAQRVYNYLVKRGTDGFFFDSTGPGAAFDERFPISLSFFTDGVKFNFKPAGEDEMFDDEYTNGEFFMDRGSQMGWNLRLKAIRTGKWLRGELPDSYLPDCLLISDTINELNGLIAEIAQPTWKVTYRGLKIDKAAKGEPSPDRFDALRLAYHRDMEYGLSAFDDFVSVA